MRGLTLGATTGPGGLGCASTAEETSPAGRYFLTEANLRLLAARDSGPHRRDGWHGVFAISGGATDPSGRRLAGRGRHFEHTVGVNSFVMALATPATALRPRGQDHRLVHRFSAAEAQGCFPWSWRCWHVWPDTCLLDQANGVELAVFFEWGRATTRRRDHLEKFRASGSFFASSQAGHLARCRLLLLTTIPAAERRIAEVIQLAAGRPPGVSLVYVRTVDGFEHAQALDDCVGAGRRRRPADVVVLADGVGSVRGSKNKGDRNDMELSRK